MKILSVAAVIVLTAACGDVQDGTVLEESTVSQVEQAVATCADFTGGCIGPSVESWVASAQDLGDSWWALYTEDSPWTSWSAVPGYG